MGHYYNYFLHDNCVFYNYDKKNNILYTYDSIDLFKFPAAMLVHNATGHIIFKVWGSTIFYGESTKIGNELRIPTVTIL